MLRRRILRAPATAVATALAALCAVVPFCGSASARLAKSLVCPEAPAGWTASPQNPVLYGPAENPGQNAQEVQCSYIKAGKVMVVTADFALPTDQDPYADFDYGCSYGGDQAWTANGRTYIVTSKHQWGYAELVDYNHVLSGGEVGVFEGLTRELLADSEGFGHGCSLDTKRPVSAEELFLFSFEWSTLGPNYTEFGGVSSASPGNPLIPEGSFTTVSTATGSSLLEKVIRIHAPAIALTIVQRGHERTVTIKIVRGVDYATNSTTDRLRMRVQVVASDDAACPQGSRGTLTLSTTQFLSNTTGNAALGFDLCGKLFSRGRPETIAQIVSG
jgi:hypothetical protein